MKRDLVTAQKEQDATSQMIYKFSDVAIRIGITVEAVVDPNSGEVKAQIKRKESAQLFIIENLENII